MAKPPKLGASGAAGVAGGARLLPGAPEKIRAKSELSSTSGCTSTSDFTCVYSSTRPGVQEN